MPSAQAAIATGGPPPRLPVRLDRPHGGVEREEIEQAHHRLGALRDVVDELGLQGMHQPDEGRRKRETVGAAAVLAKDAPEDTAQCAEEQQRRDDQHRDVPGPERRGFKAAHGVADGERQTDDRPPRHRALHGCADGIGQRPEVADERVADDGAGVVKDKWRAEAIGVDEETAGDQRHGVPSEVEDASAGAMSPAAPGRAGAFSFRERRRAITRPYDRNRPRLAQ